MTCKAAIFDLDGTILDTLEDLCDAVNAALTQFFFPLRSLSEVRAFVGNGIRKLIERAVPAGTPVSQINGVHAAFTAYYTVHCADKTRPYDGILPLLAVLREHGIATAVVSNKADYAVQSLCQRYFDGQFSVAVGERDGIRRKPAPDSVNAVLQALHCAPQDAIYIGDSEVDIATARNAGIRCFSVTWGFREEAFLRENGATILAATPRELSVLLMS